MKKKTARFVFEALTRAGQRFLREGDAGSDVRNLQTFLSRAGYLKKERIPGTFCPWTRAAIQRFQKTYKLEASGVADEETLRLMQRPRCGVPDFPPQEDGGGALAPFVLRGCKYDSTNLSFALVNSTADLADGHAHEIVREAFGAWQEVSKLRFTEVPPDNSPTFTVAWERSDHGDGSPFDDGGSIQGNVLAHGFFPPPCGGAFAGALHFDEFEQWTEAAATGRIRLLNVAIHEIGHLLGLSHSDQNSAIMFAFYDDEVDRLAPDDIAGIQALYGAPA